MRMEQGKGILKNGEVGGDLRREEMEGIDFLMRVAKGREEWLCWF
ncbi:hypothetical protein [Cytobacillus oceanisediminis]|nr:hypothetical protein [Cytobacillus oceanisediminis]